MLVTLYPPKVDGIVIIPDVDVGTAVDEGEPPPTLASPFATIYVHVIPLTVSVKARVDNEVDNTAITKMLLIAFIR